MKSILKGIGAIVRYNHMRKILHVYEKNCMPIRKISQLLYTIYRKWLLISTPTKWKVDDICPLNSSGVENRPDCITNWDVWKVDENCPLNSSGVENRPVYEKNCVPIRKISQLLHTIYRNWLLVNVGKNHLKTPLNLICVRVVVGVVRVVGTTN